MITRDNSDIKVDYKILDKIVESGNSEALVKILLPLITKEVLAVVDKEEMYYEDLLQDALKECLTKGWYFLKREGKIHNRLGFFLMHLRDFLPKKYFHYRSGIGVDRCEYYDEKIEEYYLKGNYKSWYSELLRKNVVNGDCFRNISDYENSFELAISDDIILESYFKDCLRIELLDALGTLPDRLKDIVEKNFGLNGNSVMTLTDIAKEYLLALEPIRQSELKALRMLRHPCRSNKLKDYL